MLYASLLFFIIAIVAAILGFGVLAQTSAIIAQVLFWASLLVAISTGIAYIMRRPKSASGRLETAKSASR